MPFLAICLRAAIYILIIAGFMHGVLLEAQWTGAGFHEVGFTEFTQSIALIIGSIFALLASRRSSPYRHVALLALALLLACLIREQDNYLKDHVFHGAWELLLILCVAPLLYIVIRNGRQFLVQMRNYACSFSFGLFAAGFLTVFFYAQLLGRTIFWKALMGDDYVRAVKRAAEESTELFGYALLAFAMAELWLLVRRLQDKS